MISIVPQEAPVCYGLRMNGTRQAKIHHQDAACLILHVFCGFKFAMDDATLCAASKAMQTWRSGRPLHQGEHFPCFFRRCRRSMPSTISIVMNFTASASARLYMRITFLGFTWCRGHQFCLNRAKYRDCWPFPDGSASNRHQPRSTSRS